MHTYFADVLLPLSVQGLFTYRVPQELNDKVCERIRVVVPFGKSKLYSGLILKLHETAPQQVNTKYVLDIIDEKPIVSEQQIKLWEWIAQYYMCSPGEVMAAALPSALKLASATQIQLNPAFDGDLSILTDKETKLIEALSYHTQMTVDEISKVIEIQKIIPIIKSLVDKDVIITDEEIRDPYRPKTEIYLSLASPFCDSEAEAMKLIDELGNKKNTIKQQEVILSFLMEAQKVAEHGKSYQTSIKKNDFLKNTGLSQSRLKVLIEKNILIQNDVITSRLEEFDSQVSAADIQLSKPQMEAMGNIEKQFENHSTVLLHGITGSGKTEIYIKLIDKVLSQGKQVLYLLPEIALTSQIVNRLRRFFGDKVGVYHSRFNEYERVEIWNRVLQQGNGSQIHDKYQLILGARSALLLPYSNLGLIIVDEEHDGSYKQSDPAPRYNARDCAVILAGIHKCKVLLGTATPSLESYYNAQQGKYGLVNLMHRYAESTLPEIWIVDIAKSQRQKKMQGHFSQFLIDSMGEALSKGEQIILFQNRRGYSLRLYCNTCQSMPTCAHCDVSLTYHKTSNLLKCHYCGYAIEVPKECPQCHSTDIEMRGFGTEKIEDSLAELFPDARIARMDLDTTRSKNAYQKIITDFEQHNTDILVGTQMVTKGLDFDRVSVVGILNADNLLSYPDFRSFEKAFQIMAQVSGRAGRKEVPGKVIIQTYQPTHPALQYVASNDYQSMYQQQMTERCQYHFPPQCRLIKLTLKHTNDQLVNDAANILASQLREAFPQRVLGPEWPLVSRIQNYYMKDFWIKLNKDKNLENNKLKLKNILHRFQCDMRFKSIRVVVNVDA
ncbi:MAG: primosomal protein N' [Bacteroidales bacterium]|nr:primosomal protein N' [Bacteroidales bacterium]